MSSDGNLITFWPLAPPSAISLKAGIDDWKWKKKEGKEAKQRMPASGCQLCRATPCFSLPVLMMRNRALGHYSWGWEQRCSVQASFYLLKAVTFHWENKTSVGTSLFTYHQTNNSVRIFSHHPFSWPLSYQRLFWPVLPWDALPLSTRHWLFLLPFFIHLFPQHVNFSSY